MRKGNHLYEIEVREFDKEKKRIKIHYKGFSEDTDQMSGVNMVLYLTSKDFTLCLHLLHRNLITGAQPKAGTGLKMQTVRFFNVTLLGIYR